MKEAEADTVIDEAEADVAEAEYQPLLRDERCRRLK